MKLDETDNSPGWKFAEYEMKGVPVRVEIGPRDMEAGQCVIVRRDNREKIVAALDGVAESVAAALEAVHAGLFEKALQNRTERTFTAKDYGGAQGGRRGKERLYQGDVVRRSGVRGHNQGAGGPVLPLHPL